MTPDNGNRRLDAMSDAALYLVHSKWMGWSCLECPAYSGCHAADPDACLARIVANAEDARIKAETRAHAAVRGERLTLAALAEPAGEGEGQ